MKLDLTIRRHHKLDETAADCADSIRADANRGVFAVADGVSSAIFAGAWAARLCEGALRGLPDELSANGLARWLAPLRRDMTEHIARQVEGKPWYVTEKARDGAASTLLLGQYGHTTEGWKLHLWSVGDCNLLRSSPNGGWLAWPKDDPNSFDRLPAQLASVAFPVCGFQRQILPVEEDDVVVVATDATAKWLLQAVRGVGTKQRHAWLLGWVADATASDESWQQWLDDERRSGALENDDSSVLVIKHSTEGAGAPSLLVLGCPPVPPEGYETDSETQAVPVEPLAAQGEKTEANAQLVEAAGVDDAVEAEGTDVTNPNVVVGAPRPESVGSEQVAAQRPASGSADSNGRAAEQQKAQLLEAVKRAHDIQPPGGEGVTKRVLLLRESREERQELVSDLLREMGSEPVQLLSGSAKPPRGQTVQRPDKEATLEELASALGLDIDGALDHLYSVDDSTTLLRTLQRVIAGWWSRHKGERQALWSSISGSPTTGDVVVCVLTAGLWHERNPGSGD